MLKKQYLNDDEAYTYGDNSIENSLVRLMEDSLAIIHHPDNSNYI